MGSTGTHYKKNTGFQVNEDRTEGTYSKYASLDDKHGFHYYSMFIKFGIGRATRMLLTKVMKITREEVYFVNKYDGEFPKNILLFFKYCGVNQTTFNRIIDSWRSLISGKRK